MQLVDIGMNAEWEKKKGSPLRLWTTLELAARGRVEGVDNAGRTGSMVS